jgi:translation initiation factor IF-2
MHFMMMPFNSGLQGQQIEVRRGKEVVFNGKLESLRRVKDDVEEVQEGVECGLGAVGFTSWAEGDIIECFKVVSKAQKLEDAKATTAVDLATIA